MHGYYKNALSVQTKLKHDVKLNPRSSREKGTLSIQTSVQIQSFRYMRLPPTNTKQHPSRHINITPNLCTTYRRTNAVSNNYQHVVPYCQSGTKSWYFISGRIWTQGTLERSSQGQTGPHEQDGLNRSV